MKNLLNLILLVFIPGVAFSQSFTNSNLPIVVINTYKDPNTGIYTGIYDEPRTKADMKIIFHKDGSRNYLDDIAKPEFLNYNGRIGIEIRGSSSQVSDKKSYGLSTLLNDDYTENNVSILGMPPENDWILYSINFDASLLRSFLSYELARSTGEYAPRCVYCELVINNDYKGLYVFVEKIKVDKNRVDVHKITPEDISGRDLTGGYLTKADKTTGGDPVAWTMRSYNVNTDFIHAFPSPNEITLQQNTYIKYQFTNLQKAMTSQNASIADGFPSIIDIPSFVNYMIICELASNADSYQFSTYFYKDKLGKLKAGPVWDFDLTFGNDLFFWGLDRSHYNVWQFDNYDNTGPMFWRDLFNNQIFRCYLGKRWKELTAPGAPLNYEQITDRIDKIEARIAEAVVRENNRWNSVSNHLQEISGIKNWLINRIDWMNNSLPNGSGCSSPVLPPLVISRINYNPLATAELTSDGQEFIEISNKGESTVDLTGIYFSGPGISYSFPANSKLGSYDRLFLAGDATIFNQLYGEKPFGQYARNLSNDSEKLVLADAFGNVIDSVRYYADEPWPELANGKGYYLQLSDVNADNSLASSWIASNYKALDIKVAEIRAGISVFPNPATKYLTIQTVKDCIDKFKVTDIRGRVLLEQMSINENSTLINLDPLAPGIYVLQVRFKDGKTMVTRFVKSR